MKAVLISIQPKWCELIATGKKTVEVRKTVPKLEPPFKCYIYCTNAKPYLVWGDVFRGSWVNEITTLSGYNRKEAEKIWDLFNGKVMGEFVCDEIKNGVLTVSEYVDSVNIGSKETCLTIDEIKAYLGMKCVDIKGQYDFYGWHISDLVIYDEPKPLSEFYKCGAVPMEDLDEELCNYCPPTGYGDTRSCYTPNGLQMCEGRWCAEAYQKYLDDEFALTRAPQSWCYVQEV